MGPDSPCNTQKSNIGNLSEEFLGIWKKLEAESHYYDSLSYDLGYRVTVFGQNDTIINKRHKQPTR